MASIRKNSVDMVNGPLGKNIWIYSVPVVLTGILQLFFNAADLVVVGRFCGSVCVAAVGATNSLIHLATNIFIGLSVGVGVGVATAIGEGDDRKVHETIHTAMPVGLLCGLFMGAVGYLGAYSFLQLMDTPEDVIDLSATYLKIYFCGMPANLIYNYGAAILRADGDTKKPLIFLSSAGILNIFLNLFFVIVLGRDVDGVAYATIASQYTSAILVLISLMRRNNACRFELSKVRIYGKPLLQIIKIGLPAGLQSSLFSISNVMIQKSVNAFGSAVVAGNSAASNIEGFVYIAMNAFNQAALNFTGQNKGAGRLDRVKTIRKLCLKDVIIVGLGVGIPICLFSKSLLAIYITDSEEAIAIGSVKLALVCLPYFLCGMCDVMSGMMRGLGSSIVPMIVSIGGICGLRLLWIATIFRIERFHTLPWLYVNYPLSWIVTFAIMFVCFNFVYRRLVSES